MTELDMAIRSVRELQAANRASRSSRPLVHKLKQRRFLPLGDSEVIFVDDDGSCMTEMPAHDGRKARPHTLDDAGFADSRIHHVYVDTTGRLYTTRCPASLTFEERDHLMVDDPPGSFVAKMAARKASRASVRSSKPKTADWSDDDR